MSSGSVQSTFRAKPRSIDTIRKVYSPHFQFILFKPVQTDSLGLVTYTYPDQRENS